jgi:hypothetical protein
MVADPYVFRIITNNAALKLNIERLTIGEKGWCAACLYEDDVVVAAPETVATKRDQAGEAFAGIDLV